MNKQRFIIKSTSTNCRGWEGNGTQIIRTTKSLYEYIRAMVVKDFNLNGPDDLTDDMFVCFSGVSENTSEVNFIFDDECTTYTIVDNLDSIIEDDQY